MLGQAEDLARVGGRRGQRLVDEDGLADRRQLELLEVLAPVDALQQDGVDAARQLWNAVDYRHAELGLQLVGEALDAVAAQRELLRAAGISGHDARAGHVKGVLGVVQDVGESRAVRGVEPDHADADGGVHGE